jgi:predicted phosphodiesterase
MAESPILQLEPGTSPGTYLMRMEYYAGWEQKMLFISDIHFDAKGCNRELLKKHLDQAQAQHAPVFIFGDLLDLMQGKQDPRASKHAIREEYLTDDYLGAVTADAAAFLAPYAENILMIGQGNHEFEYRRRHEIDPLTIVATHLYAATGFRPVVAPYTGWILLKYQYKSGANTRGRRHGHNVKWHHGVGSNAPVTKGAIQSNRSAVRWPQADVVALGHIHQRFSMSMPRELVTNSGRIVTDKDALHLQLGCYIQDNIDGDSWAMRRGMGTSALGGFWLRLYCQVVGKRDPSPVKYQAIPTD